MEGGEGKSGEVRRGGRREEERNGVEKTIEKRIHDMESHIILGRIDGVNYTGESINNSQHVI